MKKFFRAIFISVLTVCSCVGCSCFREKEPPYSHNDTKSKEDYDLSNNEELVGYLDRPVTIGDYRISVDDHYIRTFFRDEDYFDIKVEALRVREDFVVVDAFVCDNDCKSKYVLFEKPQVFDFSKELYCVYRLKRQHISYPLTRDIAKNECRIFLQGANITFHLWYAPNKLTPNGKDKNEYDISNNAEVLTSLSGGVKTDNCGFVLDKYDGYFYNNILEIRIYFEREFEFDLIDLYFTDDNGGNVRSVLDSPCTVRGKKSDRFIYLVDNPDSSYYESCNQKVVFHFITNNESLAFRFYNYEINGKSKESYDLSNNETKRVLFDETIKIKNATMRHFISKTEDDRKIPFSISEGEENGKIDIVDMYFANEGKENQKHLIDAPISLLIDNKGCCDVTFTFDFSFKPYYDSCNGIVNLYIDFEDISVVLVLNQANNAYYSNGKSKDDYDSLSDVFVDYYITEDAPRQSFSFKEESSASVLVFYKTIYGIKDSIYVGFSSSKEKIFDVVDIYLTDSFNGNKISLISSPFSVENNAIFSFKLPSVNYYAECNGKIVLRIVTTVGNICIYMWNFGN